MFGLDEWIAGLGPGGGIAVALGIAVLVGLRHATDPDHLTAVSTLIASEEGGTRRASRLGLAWGTGHALTLLACGLPVVLVSEQLPDAVQQAAEFTIGAVIVALAVRLLVRWRRGYFHLHPHEHDGVRHAHPHVHRRGEEHPHVHAHEHPPPLGRTPAAALGIGLIHGIGGSAGAGILLVAAIPDTTTAAIALVLYAAATAVSMAACSAGFGHVLARGLARPRLARLVPALGVVGVLFGAWYALGALEAVPYVF